MLFINFKHFNNIGDKKKTNKTYINTHFYKIF